jgi:hypothetical protein
MADRGYSSGESAFTDLRPTELARPFDGGLAERAFGGRDGARAAMDDERRRCQGFCSGRREGPTVEDAAFLLAPVELDTPAGRRAIAGPPVAEPPFRDQPPDRNASFGATHHLGLAGFHATLPLLTRWTMLRHATV